MEPSEALVAFATQTELRSVPEAVQKKAKLSILDAIGTAALSSTLQKSKQTVRAIKRLSSGGRSTVWANGFKASPLEAALINGMLVEGLDYSDIHLGAGLHPTSVILPAVVAAGEMGRASGVDLLLSHIIGCESMISLGRSAPGNFHARAFQPTSIIGVVGAALASGRMMGLSKEEMAEDLSLATTLAFGSSLSVRVGAYFGWIDTGRAAESGVLASVMASEGIKGIATDAIEGSFGFLEAHAGKGNYDPKPITRDLGSKWETTEIFLKRYPTSFAFTFMLDAALRIKQRERIDPAEIEEVRFGENASNIGFFSEPEEVKRRPPTIYDAKTSHYFTLSLALAYGAVTAQLLLSRLKDRKLLALSDKVSYALDEKSHWVEVKLKDGRVFMESQDMLEPSPDALIRKKFLENSSPVFGEARAKRIESTVDSLEDLADVRELTKLLA